MIDGQEHCHSGVAPVDGLEVLRVITRFMIYLAVPYIEVTSVNLKTCGYGVIDSEVQCGDGVATCDRRVIGMRHDSVSMCGNGETKTVIELSFTESAKELNCNDGVKINMLNQRCTLTMVGNCPCPVNSVSLSNR